MSAGNDSHVSTYYIIAVTRCPGVLRSPQSGTPLRLQWVVQDLKLIPVIVRVGFGHHTGGRLRRRARRGLRVPARRRCLCRGTAIAIASVVAIGAAGLF